VLSGRVLQETVDDGGAVQPAVTENRLDTAEGLNRRISCIHRM